MNEEYIQAGAIKVETLTTDSKEFVSKTRFEEDRKVQEKENFHSSEELSDYHMPVDISGYHSPVDLGDCHSPVEISECHSPVGLIGFWKIMKLFFELLMSWCSNMKNICQVDENLWRRRVNTFTPNPLTKLKDIEYFKKNTQQIVWGSLHANGMSEVLCVFTAIIWFLLFIGEVLAQFGINWVKIRKTCPRSGYLSL